MKAIRKDILNAMAVVFLVMVPSQALTSDLKEKIKTYSEQTTKQMKAEMQRAVLKDAERHLKEMKIEARNAFGERLHALAKQLGMARYYVEQESRNPVPVSATPNLSETAVIGRMALNKTDHAYR